MVKAVVLLENGDINSIEISLKSQELQKNVSKVLKNPLCKKYLKNVGNFAIKNTETWKYNETYMLLAFGYIKGGKVNSHELPPPNKNIVHYGDIIIVKVNKSKINKVFVYGKAITTTFSKIKTQKKGKILNSKKEILDLIKNRLGNNDYLMVKGSNATGLHEMISQIKLGHLNAL